MNKEMLFAAIGSIDEDILERSARKRPSRKQTLWKWGALAACLGLVVASLLWVFRYPQLPPEEISVEASPDFHDCHYHDWLPVYNNGLRTEVDACRVAQPGYFGEPLTQEQLEMILPKKSADWKSVSGQGNYFRDGKVDNAVVEIVSQSERVQVTIGHYFSCAVYTLEVPAVSRCGDVEYTLYAHRTGETLLLEADTQIGGIPLHFSMTTEDESQGKMVFASVLECFSWYGGEAPALKKLAPSHVPEFISEELKDLETAAAYPEFGERMVKSIPAGYQKESIRRYKDAYTDHLSGLWTQGYDELNWCIARYTAEDALRITSVEDKKNYDLSLYPIPRAESVPAQLRQIVDDPIFLAEELTLEAVQARAYTVTDAGEGGASQRMAFSVKYEDYLVQVRTKGIAPQWVYDRLMELKNG